MESFYGGRSGAAFIIVQRFDGIDIPQPGDGSGVTNYTYTENEYATQPVIQPDGTTKMEFILTTNAAGGNVEIDGANDVYLIEKNSENYKGYTWTRQANNGDRINDTSYSFPEILARGMVQCFRKGTKSASEVNYGEYVLIDTITGNIEYELQPEHLLSNDPKLNLLNFIPKKEILINSKEEYDNLYNKYFNLLDDLIIMYNSKKEYISRTDKIEEFLNIYKNIVSEAEQVEYSLNNEFLSWCLISVPKQEIKKLNFEKSTAIIRETYLDENGHERDRERTIEVPNFSNNNSIILSSSICVDK